MGMSQLETSENVSFLAQILFELWQKNIGRGQISPPPSPRVNRVKGRTHTPHTDTLMLKNFPGQDAVFRTQLLGQIFIAFITYNIASKI